MRLAVHIGAILALTFACAPMIARLNRERKLSRISIKRRKRQPDPRSLLDMRLLKTAAIPILLAFLLYGSVHDLYERLWILGIFLCINGVVLYAPQYMFGANKDSLSMSSLDAVLIGLGGGAGVIPGVSRVGTALSVNLMRGGDRRYALDIGLLLCIPALAVLTVIDALGLFGALNAVTFISVIRYLTAGAAAFAGGYLGIYLMRFLSVRAGFSGFAYYSWGLGLFSFILYLTI